ncbi:ISAs1 family transposase [Mycoavidus cysteinexigens]|uniref:ISAs1 family transposase n=1 Tax=Mycoavidus cysteinexigens TaxID=1553431 RepID=UPI000F832606
MAWAQGYCNGAGRARDPSKRTCERRYFLCSFADIERVSHVIRAHWPIENQQHWILDVRFKEDANQTRNKQAASNLAMIRRTTLNLLRQDPSALSMRRRKMRALTNPEYREMLLFGLQRT